MQSYWTSVLNKFDQNTGLLRPLYITPDLKKEESNVNIVRGVVLAKKNM